MWCDDDMMPFKTCSDNIVHHVDCSSGDDNVGGIGGGDDRPERWCIRKYQ